MTQSKHTPTPWHNRGAAILTTCSGNNPQNGKPLGIVIGAMTHKGWKEEPEDKANAAFIVKAVNCHDQLVFSLKYMVSVYGTDHIAGKLAKEALQDAGAA